MQIIFPNSQAIDFDSTIHAMHVAKSNVNKFMNSSSTYGYIKNPQGLQQ